MSGNVVFSPALQAPIALTPSSAALGVPGNPVGIQGQFPTVPGPVNVGLTGAAPKVSVSASVATNTGAITTASAAPTLAIGAGGTVYPAQLVQHYAGSNTRSTSVATFASPYGFYFQLPSITTTGNTVIVSVTWNGIVTPTVTDDQSNAYTLASIYHDATSGQSTAIAYSIGVKAGARNLAVKFSGAPSGYVQVAASEFTNIIAVDGSSVGSAGTSTSASPGSITPSVANDFIYQSVYFTSQKQSLFAPVAQANMAWQLLSADSLDGLATQGGNYSSTGSVSPAMTLGTSGRWVTTAISFKTGSTGAVPAGLRIARLLHYNFPYNAAAGGTGNPFTGGAGIGPGTVNVQVPCSGNCLVAWAGGGASPGSSVSVLSACSDSNGNAWSAIPGAFSSYSGKNVQCFPFYAPNCLSADNLAVTTTWYASNTDVSILFYDVVGAAVAPFDAAVINHADAQTANPLTIGSITPAGAGELILAQTMIYYNTAYELTGGYNDANYFDGMSQSGPQPIDQNNGWGHFITGSGLPISVQWTFLFGEAVSSWASSIVALKSAVSGSPPVITVQPANVTVTAPAAGVFSITATGATSYQWYLNGAAITGATTASYNTGATTVPENGSSVYCVVTNTSGSVTSNKVILTVQAAASQTAGLPVTLKLTPSITGTMVPWTTGHAFVQGNVPSGNAIAATSGTTNFQADVRNLWPDGSVKFAVLSGISNWPALTQQSVVLNLGAAASGAAVPEPTILNVQCIFTGAVTGTYTLQSVLGVHPGAWSYGSSGLVRTIPGPVMSEYHYYLQTTDAHVALWFFVRAYTNGSGGTGLIEVETVVENGWWQIASPAEKDYTVTHSVNGATTFSGSISHYSHTRWSRVDWPSGGGPTVPQHDPVYLRATKMVPNYGLVAPDVNAWTGFPSSINPVPFAQGQWPIDGADSASTGYHSDIGILTEWDSKYVTVAAPQAYYAAVSNSRGAGRWPTHYRDETTGRPPSFDTYSTYGIAQDDGYGQAPSAPPSYSGGSLGFDIPHHGSMGYLAYLIEGRWNFLEEVEFLATFVAFAEFQSNRSQAPWGNAVLKTGSPLTTRGYAWAIRTVGQAAAAAPSQFGFGVIPTADLAVKTQLTSCIAQSAQYGYDEYIGGPLALGTVQGGAFINQLGMMGEYDSYSSYANVTMTASNPVIPIADTSFYYVNQPVFSTAFTSAGYAAVITNVSPNVSITVSPAPAAGGTQVLLRTQNPYDWWGGSWMTAFQAMAWGLVADIVTEGLSNPAVVAAVRSFVVLDSVLSCVGTNSTWNFRRGGNYDRPYAHSSTTMIGTNAYGLSGFLPAPPNYGTALMTLKQAYDAFVAARVLSTSLTASVGTPGAQNGDTLLTHGTDTATGPGSSSVADGYWALHASAVAIAVDAGVPLAQAAWNAITNASNYSPITDPGNTTTASNDPQFMFIPRSNTQTFPYQNPKLPAWLSGASTMQWVQIANTSQAALQNSNGLQAYWTASGQSSGSGGLGGVCAYSGACVAPATSELIQQGGGHADYYGNEVYSLRLADDVPAWNMWFFPGTVIDLSYNGGYGAPYSLGLTGVPAASHTYWSLHFIAKRGKMFRCGTGSVSGNGNGHYPYVDSIALRAAAWDSAGTNPAMPGAELAMPCIKDGFENMWAWNYVSGVLMKWTESTNTWASVTTLNVNNTAYETPWCCDTRRNQVIRSAGPNGTSPTGVLDLNNPTADFSSITFTGAIVPTNGNIVYDPIVDCYWYMQYGSSTLYKIDPVSWVVTAVSVTGSTPDNTQTNGLQNFYGRFNYVPQLKGLVFMRDGGANVYFMRTA